MDNRTKLLFSVAATAVLASGCAGNTVSKNVGIVNTIPTVDKATYEAQKKANPEKSAEEIAFQDTKNLSTRVVPGTFFDDEYQYVTDDRGVPLVSGEVRESSNPLQDTAGTFLISPVAVDKTFEGKTFGIYQMQSGLRVGLGLLLEAADVGANWMGAYGDLLYGQAADAGKLASKYTLNNSSYSTSSATGGAGGSAFLNNTNNVEGGDTNIDINNKNHGGNYWNENNNNNWFEPNTWMEQCIGCEPTTSVSPTDKDAIKGATSTYGLQAERVVAVVDGAGKPTRISRMTVAGNKVTCG